MDDQEGYEGSSSCRCYSVRPFLPLSYYRPQKTNRDTKLIYSSVSFHSSDFENKFVCGEIMSYEDLREYGSEASVKAAGKLRQQGKPYESTSFLLVFSFCLRVVDLSYFHFSGRW